MTATTLGDDQLVRIGNISGMALRIFALSIVAACLAFLINNYLTFWQDWPGIGNLFSHLDLFGAEALRKPFPEVAVLLGSLQILLYVVLIGTVVAYVVRTSNRGLRVDAAHLSGAAAFIIRAAFWSS